MPRCALCSEDDALARAAAYTGDRAAEAGTGRGSRKRLSSWHFHTQQLLQVRQDGAENKDDGREFCGKLSSVTREVTGEGFRLVHHDRKKTQNNTPVTHSKRKSTWGRAAVSVTVQSTSRTAHRLQTGKPRNLNPSTSTVFSVFVFVVFCREQISGL